MKRSGLKRTTGLKRGRGFQASPEQREKVAWLGCRACPVPHGCQPAHVIPRSMGGCDHPDCVVPLCAVCHRLYDTGSLDLLPFLEPNHHVELAHAVSHVGLVCALERITNARWSEAA